MTALLFFLLFVATTVSLLFTDIQFDRIVFAWLFGTVSILMIAIANE